MKLSNLQIEEFRGVRCLELSFSTDGILIYGPNGVGKSSILQSIEYLLTGSVERLTGSGSGRQPVENDLHHKEAIPEKSRVTATFVNEDTEVQIRRSVDSGELELLSDHEDRPQSLKTLQAAMESKQNVLSRDELLKFIDAPDHRRSEALNDILRLDEIDSYRKTLDGVVGDYSDACQKKQDELDRARRDFYEELSDDIEVILDNPIPTVASDGTALDVVNRLRGTYDATPIDSLDEDQFTANITEPEQPSAHPLTRSTTVNRLDQIGKTVDNFIQTVAEPLHELGVQVESLESQPELQRDIRAQNLIDQGQELVHEETDQCPLCLTDWSDGDLAGMLNERRENASRAEEIRRHIRSQVNELESTLKDVEQQVSQLCEDLDGKIPRKYDNVSAEIAALEKFETEIGRARKNIGSGDLLDVPFQGKTASEIEEDLVPSGLPSAIDNLINISNSVEEPKDRMAAYRTLAIAEDRYQTYRDLKGVVGKYKKRREIAKELFTEFQGVRSRLLDKTLNGIKEEFVNLLENFSEEIFIDSADYKFESYDKGIRFRTPFHDGNAHRPNLLFSEGQQDIMGLSLFLSMCKVVTEDQVNIILLDDVLSSVDAEHRANVAKILESEYGEDFQFIFTTHDTVWSRHLRRTSHVDSENVVHLSGWSYNSGVHQHIDITDPQKNIEFHLQNNDLAAAAAWGRKTAEFYAAKGCENFDVDVPFKDIENMSLSDYLQALMPEVSNLLREGSLDDETVYSQSDVDDIMSEIGDIQSFIKQNLWELNKNVHYSRPEAATYSESELRSNLSSFETLFDVLYCEVCDCWRTETDTGIECDCSLLWKT